MNKSFLDRSKRKHIVEEYLHLLTGKGPVNLRIIRVAPFVLPHHFLAHCDDNKPRSKKKTVQR